MTEELYAAPDSDKVNGGQWAPSGGAQFWHYLTAVVGVIHGLCLVGFSAFVVIASNQLLMSAPIKWLGMLVIGLLLIISSILLLARRKIGVIAYLLTFLLLWSHRFYIRGLVGAILISGNSKVAMLSGTLSSLIMLIVPPLVIAMWFRWKKRGYLR